jgi:uncharacterized protein YbaP (TraB family)
LLVGLGAVAEAREPFSEGLLWRVSKAGLPDSFVFGTIHVADARVAELPKPVEDALARSRTFAMELVPEAVEGQLDELEQFDDGRRLPPLIGDDTFARLAGELDAQNVPRRVAERLKPWAAMIRITRVPGGAQGGTLDERLLAVARAHRLRVTSLELVDEQVAAFDAVPFESQVAMLRHALDHRDALAATLEPTIAAWQRRDLAALAHIPDRMSRDFPDVAVHYRRFAKHLIDDRTALMHYRLFIPLREGRVFAAIGATHLYGSRGLLAMLGHDGYKVTRIW